METMLIGKKYYERVTQPIITTERGSNIGS